MTPSSPFPCCRSTAPPPRLLYPLTHPQTCRQSDSLRDILRPTSHPMLLPGLSDSKMGKYLCNSQSSSWKLPAALIPVESDLIPGAKLSQRPGSPPHLHFLSLSPELAPDFPLGGSFLIASCREITGGRVTQGRPCTALPFTAKVQFPV